jgi:hypothetical protein
METVIKIVRGAAGKKIIPLLVRMSDRRGVEWVLRPDHESQDDMSHSWVLVCEYLLENYDAASFELFVDVADTYVQWNIWSPVLLMCLQSQDFLFLKQFLFRCHQNELDEYVLETLRGFANIARNDKIIEQWVASGHANVFLWNAVHKGLRRSEFLNILSDARINPNISDPRPMRLINTSMAHHPFIRKVCSPPMQAVQYRQARHQLQSSLFITVRLSSVQYKNQIGNDR